MKVVGKHVKLEIETAPGTWQDISDDVRFPAEAAEAFRKFSGALSGGGRVETWRCQYCNQVNADDALFCAHCGGDMP